MEQENNNPGKRTSIVDPNPARRKHLTEILMKFMEDKVSLAEMKGISRTDLFKLAEAGYVKLKHGRVDEAQKIFQALIILDHRNAYFHSVMGAIHQKQNKPVEAIMEYTQSIKIDKKETASYVNRGEIYLRHKNYKKAAEDFRSVILLDPKGADLWSNRARSLVIAIKRSMEADQRRPKRRKVVVK